MEIFSVKGLSGDELIVKEFFNAISSPRKFIQGISLITKGIGYTSDEEYCLFPDHNGSDEDLKFIGVMFGGFYGSVIVTDDYFSSIVNEACLVFKKLNPEASSEVDEILSGRLI